MNRQNEQGDVCHSQDQNIRDQTNNFLTISDHFKSFNFLLQNTSLRKGAVASV